MSLPQGYKQIKVLPQGYFATVTACTDPSGRHVAFKRLRQQHATNDSYRSRFAREIEITSSLSTEDGVVQILDTGSHEDLPFYTMPLADTNMYNHIRHHNSDFDDDARLDLCRQILRTMASAHARGIIHRDLSPQNILVYRQNQSTALRIADFGLGKSSDAIRALTTSSQANYGQALYVSPEQRERLAQGTARSDVYSLGRLIDFIMTGRDPDNAGQHVMSVVCRRSSQYDPSERFENAAALSTAFESHAELLYGSTVSAESFDELADLKDPIDWPAVHRLLTTGQKTMDTAYWGYLDPVITFLTNDNRLTSYCDAVGPSFDDFVIRFCEEVNAAPGEVGWPFEAARRFFGPLVDLYKLTHSTDAKTACFMSVWKGSCVHDRWAARGPLQTILEYTKQDMPLQAHLAAQVVEVGGRYLRDEIVMAAPDGPLKNAIRRIRRDNRASEEA